MKKQLKKVMRPFVKPLTSRFNNLRYELENTNIALNNLYQKNILLENEIKELKKAKEKNRILEINQLSNVENIFYYHGGSGNHGCEVLVRTISDICSFDKNNNLLYSYRPEEDYLFGLNGVTSNIIPSSLLCDELIDYYQRNSIAFSIGGDNYCGYPEGTKRLQKYNEEFNKRGVRTALIGCSIEPDVLDHQEVLDDLEQFSLITARETITYDALVKHGITRNTKLIPDSAFTLKNIELPLPENFIEGKTIGINLSNMVNESNSKIYDNYTNLIKYIINETDYNIALIPHVVQSFNDDSMLINKLYREFCDTNRVCKIDNHNCMELKGYIKRCIMFIGARTHSTIAAYSTCVPTLVVGYSVKSRGIAKDLFGTYDNYVLSVENFKTDNDLVNGFKWLDENKKDIKKHLEKIMPDYIKRCYELKDVIEELRKKEEKQEGLACSNSCTGCGACSNICPKKCIEMVEDEKWFKHPQIDYTKCIHCNQCKNVCPVLKDNISSKPLEAYAAFSIDEKIRMSSSSGGVFSLLATEILKSKGIVVGATLNNHKVEHIVIDNLKDLKKLKKSKYVQSDIKFAYKEVKKKLDKNIKVMFSGTACQVAGLKSYLKKDYTNLICVDVVCHGVPSPKVFDKYLDSIEEENNIKVTDVNFRSKVNGWNPFSIDVDGDNRKIISEGIYDNVYMKAFLQNLILRNSCYECKFKNFKAQSDITLGDYWGIEQVHGDDNKFLDNKGVSLVFINTIKGRNIFNNICSELYYKKTDIDEACKYNTAITKSVNKSEKYEKYWNNVSFEDTLGELDEYTK